MGATGKLQLRLFGRFAITAGDDKPVAVTGKKNQALLAYLAANAGKAQPRESLNRRELLRDPGVVASCRGRH